MSLARRAVHAAIASLVPLSLATFAACSAGPTAVVSADAAEEGASPTAEAGSPTPNEAGATDASKPTAIAPMGGPRVLFSLSATPHGLVAVGGLSAAVLDAIDVLDPARNTWRMAGEDVVPRYGHGAAVDAAGSLYVLGGTRDGSTPIASASLVDPGTGTSAELPDMPEARLGLGAAVVGDEVLVFGGRGPNGATADEMLVYDTRARTWSRGPKMPSRRLAFATVVAGSRVYLVGGRDATDVPVAAVESYDTVTKTFRTEPSLVEARYWLCAAALADGTIVTIGGTTSSGFSDTIEVLRDGAFRKAATLPDPRGWHACARGGDGRVYVAGGAIRRGGGSPTPRSDVLAFDPRTNAVTEAAASP